MYNTELLIGTLARLSYRLWQQGNTASAFWRGPWLILRVSELSPDLNLGVLHMYPDRNVQGKPFLQLALFAVGSDVPYVTYSLYDDTDDDLLFAFAYILGSYAVASRLLFDLMQQGIEFKLPEDLMPL